MGISTETLLTTVSIAGAICFMAGLLLAALFSSGRANQLEDENARLRDRIHHALRQVTPHANATVNRMARMLRGPE